MKYNQHNSKGKRKQVNNPNIVVRGNIGRDPELKFGKTGNAVASISIGVTPRVLHEGAWNDAPTLWYKASFFGAKAEKVVDTFTKGMRVQLEGQLNQTSWIDKEGQLHTGWEIGNAEISPAPWVMVEKAVESPFNQAVQVQPVAVSTSDVAPF